MTVLVIGGQKGGTGKTTLASNIVVFLAQKDFKVLLIDGDPQKSASEWIDARNEQKRLPLIHSIEKTSGIKQTVSNLKKDYDHIVIDLQGSDTTSLGSCLIIADMFCTTVRPSKFDLNKALNLEDLINEAKENNQKLKAFVVLTQIHATDRTNKEQIRYTKAIDENMPSFKRVESVTKTRYVYQRAIEKGLSVLECEDKKAKEEIKRICEEMYGK